MACWVWNPELPSYSYSDLSTRFLQAPGTVIQSVGRRGSGPISVTSNIPRLTEDLLSCFRLYRALSHQLASHDLTHSLEVEMRVVPSLSKMEFFGIGFDSERIKSYQEALQARKRELAEEATTLLHRKVVLSSPADVATALYSDLALPKPKMRSWQKKKRTSVAGEDAETVEPESWWEGATKDSALQGLVSLHRFPQLVLDYRQCKYLLSNWISSLPAKALPQLQGGSYICSQWSQTGTSTGRISCSSPNLQSLPKRVLQLVMN